MIIGKFGKKSPVYDPRTLRLENFFNVPKLPQLPETSNWFAKASPFSMAGNDDYGDCVVAGAAHMIQTWSANAGTEHFISDQKIIATYLKLTGGQDTGLNMLAFLKFWRATGLDGHKIGAFAAIDPQNLTSVRYANYLFGGIFFGFNLPESIQGQKTWDVPANGPKGKGTPGSLGGHCVNGGIATPRMVKVGTWGAEQWVTVNFVGTYCDEAWAVLSTDWLRKDKKAPPGFDLVGLQAYLKAVTA